MSYSEYWLFGPWLMIFWSRVRWFVSDFEEWRNYWQITSRVTKRIVIHDNECINLFLTRYFRSRTENSTKNNHRSLILLRNGFSDLSLRRHHGWSVTSSEREVLALWRHIHRLFLPAQFGSSHWILLMTTLCDILFILNKRKMLRWNDHMRT